MLNWYIKANKNLPIGRLYHRLQSKGVVSKEELRRFEKVVLKLATYRQHLRYFDRCIELDLIPEFIKFKPPEIEAYKNPKMYYTQVVKEQRRLTATTLKEIKAEYITILKHLRQTVSTFDFRLFLVLLKEQVVKKSMLDKTKTHNKKLYALWQNQRPETPNCIINYSSKELNLSERYALIYGLNNHILPSNVDALKIKSSIDSQMNRICYFNKINLTYDDKNSIREATDRFVHEAEQLCNTKKNRHLHKTLRCLSNNKTIKVCKMDKGVGLVVMNSVDYYAKLDNIISDGTRFTCLDYDINTNRVHDCKSAPWVIKENKIARYCREHLKDLVDEQTYRRIKPTGSQPGKIYGMAKNHKPQCPLRPVLSAIDTPEYQLAKWLEEQIKPYLSSDYSVSSTSAFVEELSHIKPRSSDVLVSFDIKSLYTNVPLKEVISDIQRKVYSTSATSSFFLNSGITETVFKNMLQTCSESIFLYKDNVYKQHDGLSMGSPLAPLMANWFVAKIENQIFERSISCKPKFYRRYVDDIFAVFDSTADRDEFFDILNNQHQNLIFTMETNKGQLPFLDVSVSISNGKYNTRVYRKPTNTGVMMNFNCEAPTSWKKSLIRCLLLRAFRNSSDFYLFQVEIETLKSILKKNAYPEYFFNKIISEFLSKYGDNENDFQRKKNELKNAKPQLVVKEFDEVYLNIPYFGRPSHKLHRNINHRMRTHNIWVKAAYKTSKTGSYFGLKSKCSHLFASNVVYKFTCSRDENISYLGETRRQLFQRINEHTDRTRDSPIFDHLLNCEECSETSNIAKCFEIIRRCKRSDLYSLECLMIVKTRPVLNNKLGPNRGTQFSMLIYK